MRRATQRVDSFRRRSQMRLRAQVGKHLLPCGLVLNGPKRAILHHRMGRQCARSLRRRAFAKAGPALRRCHRASLSRTRAGSEAFEQGLGADQVGRAEALREPIINGLQQCQGFIAAALALP
jgi:hypothetical protein